MVYPSSIHRLVMIGNLYADTFNVTLSIVHETGAAVDLPAVTSGLTTAVGTAVGAWWPKALQSTPGGGITIAQDAKLTSVKLNRIGEDGLYQDSTVHEHVFGSPVSGTFTGRLPAQLSIVGSLLGTFPRGSAGKGRMYFPPSELCQPTTTDGRASVIAITQYAHGVASLLRDINTAYSAQGFDAVAGIASRVGSGHVQTVAQVSVGRVIDTMRSRRNKLDEDKQTVSV